MNYVIFQAAEYNAVNHGTVDHFALGGGGWLPYGKDRGPHQTIWQEFLGGTNMNDSVLSFSISWLPTVVHVSVFANRNTSF